MTAFVSPIHTGRLNGQPVRFFKGPTGGPELPWHAVDDLYRALGLPRAVRRQLLRMTQETWRQELRTVATTDGVVTIAPHDVAQACSGQRPNSRAHARRWVRTWRASAPRPVVRR
jgi:hypothetical protein